MNSWMIGAGITAYLTSAAVAYSQAVLSPVDVECVQECVKEDVCEVDPWDRQLLAHVIYGESGGCSEECQRYVGSVVLNRVKSDLYPNTIEEVVYQTTPAIQYGCTVSPAFDEEPDAKSYMIADELLRYGSVLPENVVFQSEYIQGPVYKEIDGVYFCEVGAWANR